MEPETINRKVLVTSHNISLSSTTVDDSNMYMKRRPILWYSIDVTMAGEG